MEISSKEDMNVDTAFLTMVKEVHCHNIGINDNKNNNLLKYKNNQNNSSLCCG